MNTLSRRSLALMMHRTSSPQLQAIRLSSHSGEKKVKRWERWQDVPDDWVLPSKRMPDNPYYTTETWKKIKKKQIYYQQEALDDVPVWLIRGYPYNYIYWVMGVMLFISSYYAFTGMMDGHFFPKKKKAE